MSKIITYANYYIKQDFAFAVKFENENCVPKSIGPSNEPKWK